jgi:hypothetical protein
VYSAFWRRVWRAPVSNHVRVFAFRLAHAALPCAAMAACMQSRPLAAAFCPHCPAPAPRGRRPLETYTHLFLECPLYRPALEWLADVWQAVAGQRPPLVPAVIVADDMRAWPAAPTGALVALWTALRLTVLYCVWRARVARDALERTAGAVVRSAIATLRAEMRLQYNRGQLCDSLADDLPAELLARAPLPAAWTFADVWAGTGLCRVDPSASAGGSHRLVVLLSAHHPVAAPP